MLATQDADSPTTAPSGEGSVPAGDEVASSLLQGADLLWFAGVVLVAFALIYLAARLLPAKGLTGASSYVTFARLYGLVTVAVLAVLLAFADVAADARTAAFAVLGTIAGYLAGAASTTTTTREPSQEDPTTTVTQSGM